MKGELNFEPKLKTLAYLLSAILGFLELDVRQRTKMRFEMYVVPLYISKKLIPPSNFWDRM